MSMVVQISLLLLVFVFSSDACSCVVKEWAPHHLCCRGFVLHGDVEGNKLVGNVSSPERQERIYTIKVKRIFRGLERIRNTSSNGNTSYVNIHTPPHSASCGITLEVQGSYVITGQFENNKMNSYLCSDWNTKWKDVPKSYMDFFPKMNFCKCAAGTNCATAVLLLLAMFLTAFNIS